MPAIATPPKPATPAPTPAPAAPTPTPAATPSPAAPAKTDAPDDSSVFEKFDKFSDDIPEFKKPDVEAPAKPAPATPEPGKADAVKPDSVKPATDADGIPTFKSNKELREWALGQHRTVKEMEKAKAELEKKISDLEQRIPQTNQEAEKLTATITQLQQRVDEYEQKIRFKDYQESAEYREKYVVPYQRAKTQASRQIRELFVTEPTGELDADGTAITRRRAATDADFADILNMPLGAAADAAEERFGRAAAIVLSHREKLRSISEEAFDAIESYKAQAADIRKRDDEAASVRKTSLATRWRKANEALSGDDKHKDIWGQSDDPEVNAALQKGFEFADRLFGEEHEKMPENERIFFDAMARHRLAAFSRLTYENGKLRHALAEKDREISQLRESGPGPTTPGADNPTPTESKSVLDDFDNKMK